MPPPDSSDDDHSSHQPSRRRSIKIPVPWSRDPIEIRGYDMIILLVAAAIPFTAYFLYEIKTNGDAAHNQILDALAVQTYVLSLSQDKREALNISMPESLRRRIRNRRGDNEP